MRSASGDKAAKPKGPVSSRELGNLARLSLVRMPEIGPIGSRTESRFETFRVAE
jgi:hypothetical protein